MACDFRGAGVRQRAADLGISVRPFVDEDLPRVLDLLDASLGGGPAGRRPPELFAWKHLDSPFGRSLLLVAEHEERPIGLRAFMRWRFLAGERELAAVRAVDTATHPDFQGMGVFSRLTKAALDALDGQVDLVFNTPNGKSGPGYLKLGWQEVGRVPVAVRVRRPLRLMTARGARPGGPGPPPVAARPATEALADEAAVAGLLAREPALGGLATPRTAEYLRWRYGAAPLLGYRAITEERSGELVGMALFRIRPRGRLWESTVTEVLAGGDPVTGRQLLHRVARSAAVDHLTLLAPAGTPLAWAARRGGFLPSPAGILLVANPRTAGLSPDPTRLDAWALSLGDLEVF
jgi:GNAT superfamily N-acetyltransferase